MVHTPSVPKFVVNYLPKRWGSKAPLTTMRSSLLLIFCFLVINMDHQAEARKRRRARQKAWALPVLAASGSSVVTDFSTATAVATEEVAPALPALGALWPLGSHRFFDSYSSGDWRGGTGPCWQRVAPRWSQVLRQLQQCRLKGGHRPHPCWQRVALGSHRFFDTYSSGGWRGGTGLNRAGSVWLRGAGNSLTRYSGGSYANQPLHWTLDIPRWWTEHIWWLASIKAVS